MFCLSSICFNYNVHLFWKEPGFGRDSNLQVRALYFRQATDGARYDVEDQWFKTYAATVDGVGVEIFITNYNHYLCHTQMPLQILYNIPRVLEGKYDSCRGWRLAFHDPSATIPPRRSLRVREYT
jgi:hypothetical protein